MNIFLCAQALQSFSKAVHLQPDNKELWEEDLLDTLRLLKKVKEHACELSPAAEQTDSLDEVCSTQPVSTSMVLARDMSS